MTHAGEMGAGPGQVLDHWLGERSETPPDEARIARWFVADPAIDAEIRERFGPLVESALAGGLADWQKRPEERVALIIVLDQFPRNLYRESERAFAGDRRALALTRAFLRQALEALHPLEHYFALLPWMHSENLRDQRAGEKAFAHGAARVPGPFQPFFEQGRVYATKHRQVIERFGRFPHRNALLGRVSTAEESAFLEEFGTGF